MTTTAIKFIETLINDLNARAAKATGEERSRLLKAADHYTARMPASWHRAQS